MYCLVSCEEPLCLVRRFKNRVYNIALESLTRKGALVFEVRGTNGADRGCEDLSGESHSTPEEMRRYSKIHCCIIVGLESKWLSVLVLL